MVTELDTMADEDELEMMSESEIILKYYYIGIAVP